MLLSMRKCYRKVGAMVEPERPSRVHAGPTDALGSGLIVLELDGAGEEDGDMKV